MNEKKTYKVLVNYSQNETKMQLAWDGRRHTGRIIYPYTSVNLRINNSLGKYRFFSPNRDKKLDQGFDRKSNSTIELSCRFPFD